jgi:GxxExxY protein
MNENEITEKIIGCAIKIHDVLGPGLLESAYQKCLLYELRLQGLHVEGEVPLPLVYQEVRLECGYRMDLVVEDKIILEIKSVEALSELHFAQLLTYLKLRNYRLGLLINFNVLRVKDGIRRVANKFIA